MSPYEAKTTEDPRIETAVRDALVSSAKGLTMNQLVDQLASQFGQTAVRLAVWQLIARGQARLETDRRFVKAA